MSIYTNVEITSQFDSIEPQQVNRELINRIRNLIPLPPHRLDKNLYSDAIKDAKEKAKQDEELKKKLEKETKNSKQKKKKKVAKN